MLSPHTWHCITTCVHEGTSTMFLQNGVRLQIPVARLQLPVTQLQMPVAQSQRLVARIQMSVAGIQKPVARIHMPVARMQVPVARLQVLVARLQVPVVFTIPSPPPEHLGKTFSMPRLLFIVAPSNLSTVCKRFITPIVVLSERV